MVRVSLPFGRVNRPARCRIWWRKVASCSKCHRFAREGGDIGPDLTEVRAKLPRELALLGAASEDVDA